MAIWHAPDEVPADLGPAVVTIGVFDGVHRGHQAVVGRAGEHARKRGLPLVVITFDPNPIAVIRPDLAPPPLTSVAERAELLTSLAGADHVLVLPFSRDRSEQPAEDFVAEILRGVLHAEVIVVGEDFRFGYRARGNVDLLQRLGAEQGFEVDAMADVGEGDTPRWSSTGIRALLADGDVAGAAEALGRPWRVGGVVVRGDRRGRQLGFPTANVPTPEGIAVPADGVYAGWMIGPDESGTTARMPAAISVGSNPTFDGAGHRVEAYVLDRDDLDLYGATVLVEFVERIRGMERFGSVEDLIAAMNVDVDRARVLLG